MKIFAYLKKNAEFEIARNSLLAAETHYNFKIDQMVAEDENKYVHLQDLLSSAQSGDILLVPKFIVLARLPGSEWKILRKATGSGLNVVALNLTSTLRGLRPSNAAERLASRASTETLMELTENVITYVQTSPEFAKRKSPSGSAAGRPVDETLHHRISLLLLSGASYSEIQKTLKCGRSTISRVKQTMQSFQTK